MANSKKTLLEKQHHLFNRYLHQGLDPEIIAEFRENIWDYYKKNQRVLPWRETDDPYAILVSEIMLQQTQVDRVLPKYTEFLLNFPTFEKLASAPLSKILHSWQGLGYNRRALYLRKTAESVVTQFNSVLPDTAKTLRMLPGIGTYTANALLVFVFNQPVVVVETNIRSVYIFYFFSPYQTVSDKELEELINKTVDRENPKEWYYALMDYGSMLKKNIGNISKQSKHYSKQSPLEGSDRQIRAKIIKLLLIEKALTSLQLIKLLGVPSERATAIIGQMVKDGIVERKNAMIRIKD